MEERRRYHDRELRGRGQAQRGRGREDHMPGRYGGRSNSMHHGSYPQSSMGGPWPYSPGFSGYGQAAMPPPGYGPLAPPGFHAGAGPPGMYGPAHMHPYSPAPGVAYPHPAYAAGVGLQTPANPPGPRPPPDPPPSRAAPHPPPGPPPSTAGPPPVGSPPKLTQPAEPEAGEVPMDIETIPDNQPVPQAAAPQGAAKGNVKPAGSLLSGSSGPPEYRGPAGSLSSNSSGPPKYREAEASRDFKPPLPAKDDTQVSNGLTAGAAAVEHPQAPSGGTAAPSVVAKPVMKPGPATVIKTNTLFNRTLPRKGMASKGSQGQTQSLTTSAQEAGEQLSSHAASADQQAQQQALAVAANSASQQPSQAVHAASEQLAQSTGSSPPRYIPAAGSPSETGQPNRPQGAAGTASGTVGTFGGAGSTGKRKTLREKKWGSPVRSLEVTAEAIVSMQPAVLPADGLPTQPGVVASSGGPVAAHSKAAAVDLAALEFPSTGSNILDPHAPAGHTARALPLIAQAIYSSHVVSPTQVAAPSPRVDSTATATTGPPLYCSPNIQSDHGMGGVMDPTSFGSVTAQARDQGRHVNAAATADAKAAAVVLAAGSASVLPAAAGDQIAAAAVEHPAAAAIAAGNVTAAAHTEQLPGAIAAAVASAAAAAAAAAAARSGIERSSGKGRDDSRSRHSPSRGHGKDHGRSHSRRRSTSGSSSSSSSSSSDSSSSSSSSTSSSRSSSRARSRSRSRSRHGGDRDHDRHRRRGSRSPVRSSGPRRRSRSPKRYQHAERQHAHAVRSPSKPDRPLSHGEASRPARPADSRDRAELRVEVERDRHRYDERSRSRGSDGHLRDYAREGDRQRAQACRSRWEEQDSSQFGGHARRPHDERLHNGGRPPQYDQRSDRKRSPDQGGRRNHSPPQYADERAKQARIDNASHAHERQGGRITPQSPFRAADKRSPDTQSADSPPRFKPSSPSPPPVLLPPAGPPPHPPPELPPVHQQPSAPYHALAFSPPQYQQPAPPSHTPASSPPLYQPPPPALLAPFQPMQPLSEPPLPSCSLDNNVTSPPSSPGPPPAPSPPHAVSNAHEAKGYNVADAPTGWDGDVGIWSTSAVQSSANFSAPHARAIPGLHALPPHAQQQQIGVAARAPPPSPDEVKASEARIRRMLFYDLGRLYLPDKPEGVRTAEEVLMLTTAFFKAVQEEFSSCAENGFPVDEDAAPYCVWDTEDLAKDDVDMWDAQPSNSAGQSPAQRMLTDETDIIPLEAVANRKPSDPRLRYLKLVRKSPKLWPASPPPPGIVELANLSIRVPKPVLSMQQEKMLLQYQAEHEAAKQAAAAAAAAAQGGAADAPAQTFVVPGGFSAVSLQAQNRIKEMEELNEAAEVWQVARLRHDKVDWQRSQEQSLKQLRAQQQAGSLPLDALVVRMTDGLVLPLNTAVRTCKELYWAGADEVPPRRPAAHSDGATGASAPRLAIKCLVELQRLPAQPAVAQQVHQSQQRLCSHSELIRQSVRVPHARVAQQQQPVIVMASAFAGAGALDFLQPNGPASADVPADVAGRCELVLSRLRQVNGTLVQKLDSHPWQRLVQDMQSQLRPPAPLQGTGDAGHEPGAAADGIIQITLPACNNGTGVQRQQEADVQQGAKDATASQQPAGLWGPPPPVHISAAVRLRLAVNVCENLKKHMGKMLEDTFHAWCEAALQPARTSTAGTGSLQAAEGTAPAGAADAVDGHTTAPTPQELQHMQQQASMASAGAMLAPETVQGASPPARGASETKLADTAPPSPAPVYLDNSPEDDMAKNMEQYDDLHRPGKVSRSLSKVTSAGPSETGGSRRSVTPPPGGPAGDAGLGSPAGVSRKGSQVSINGGMATVEGAGLARGDGSLAGDMGAGPGIRTSANGRPPLPPAGGSPPQALAAKQQLAEPEPEQLAGQSVDQGGVAEHAGDVAMGSEAASLVVSATVAKEPGTTGGATDVKGCDTAAVEKQLNQQPGDVSEVNVAKPTHLMQADQGLAVAGPSTKMPSELAQAGVSSAAIVSPKGTAMTSPFAAVAAPDAAANVQQAVAGVKPMTHAREQAAEAASDGGEQPPEHCASGEQAMQPQSQPEGVNTAAAVQQPATGSEQHPSVEVDVKGAAVEGAVPAAESMPATSPPVGQGGRSRAGGRGRLGRGGSCAPPQARRRGKVLSAGPGASHDVSLNVSEHDGGSDEEKVDGTANTKTSARGGRKRAASVEAPLTGGKRRALPSVASEQVLTVSSEDLQQAVEAAGLPANQLTAAMRQQQMLEQRVAQQFKEQTHRVLYKLENHKDFRDDFGTPVLDQDPQLADDYLQAVKQPMDLSTVRSKLTNGEYPTTKEGCESFVKDLRLIGENCLAFQQWLKDRALRNKEARSAGQPVGEVHTDPNDYFEDLAEKFLKYLDKEVKNLWDSIVPSEVRSTRRTASIQAAASRQAR